jgi:hypothetical protein
MKMSKLVFCQETMKPGRWRHYFPPKRWYPPPSPYGVTILNIKSTLPGTAYISKLSQSNFHISEPVNSALTVAGLRQYGGGNNVFKWSRKQASVS